MGAESKTNGNHGSTTGDWNGQVSELFAGHFDALCHVAQRFLDNRHAAEEAVQEAFVRFTALQSRPREGSELPYLRSMVLNEARSTLRHRQVVRRASERTLQEPDRDQVSDTVLANESVRHVRSHVQLLPLRQQQVVSLRHLAGLSEKETAALLSISAGSVKTHASRGLSALRDRLQESA